MKVLQGKVSHKMAEKMMVWGKEISAPTVPVRFECCLAAGAGPS